MTSARWSLDATREAPTEGRRLIREFAASANATSWALDAIALCVTEAITNVVLHAYRNQEHPGRVELEAEFAGEWLCIRVRDHGHGLKPRLDSPGLGLGLPLIAQISARSEIVSSNQGTEIIMRFDAHEQKGDGRL
ncbi:MAG TPA: ATP-binding protein [Solirubrobacter sp.]|nr:ATP-binding protein [Solirubrobacter sp.]